MLKAEGRHVTATAIYTTMQAYMALEAGADYIAPYFNRIANLGGDPKDLIAHIEGRIDAEGYDCKILAASFHALSQVEDAFDAGRSSRIQTLPRLSKTLTMTGTMSMAKAQVSVIFKKTNQVSNKEGECLPRLFLSYFVNKSINFLIYSSDLPV